MPLNDDTALIPGPKWTKKVISAPKPLQNPKTHMAALVKAIDEIHETWFNVGRGEDEDEVLKLLMSLPSGVCSCPLHPLLGISLYTCNPPPSHFEQPSKFLSDGSISFYI